MSQPPAAASKRSASLRDTVRQFGFPIERFTPGKAATRSIRVAGLADVALGIGLAIWALATSQHIGFVFAGFGMVVSGVVLIVLSRRLASGGVLICPRGLVIASPRAVEAYLWEQIKEIRQVGAEGVPSTETVHVARKDGATTSITAVQVGDLARFVSVLRKETDRRRIPWQSA